MKLDLKSALKEIQDLTEAELEKDTAYKWAARACAAYQLSDKAKTKEEMEYWNNRGDDLRHEALEHASLVLDYGKTVSEVQKEMEKYKLSTPE